MASRPTTNRTTSARTAKSAKTQKSSPKATPSAKLSAAEKVTSSAKATVSKIRLPRVLDSTAASFEGDWDALCDRAGDALLELDQGVREAIERVRDNGDAELFASLPSAAREKIDDLEVCRDEWDQACDDVEAAARAALGKSGMRVRDFHRRRIPSSWEMREEGGAFLGQKVRPLDRVGIYAPSGAARCPSSIIMATVPASAVEVPEIVLVTPPNKDGRVDPEILMAARVAGVHRVFKAAGASAIAALTYGTETIPAVDKIIGYGDDIVVAAKRAVQGRVSVDHLVGPPELCMIADRSATPAWVAADMLSMAEQAPDAKVVLLTHTKALARRIQEQITKQIGSLALRSVAREALESDGAIVVTRNLDESITLANRYAPEHLVLAVEDPERAAKGVFSAGAILLGHYTPVAVGDYLAGPNSVLPRGGTARFGSPLGVEDFLKRTSFVKLEPSKLRELGAEAIRLAEIEGFGGHSVSIDLRLQKIRRTRREREAAREAEA